MEGHRTISSDEVLKRNRRLPHWQLGGSTYFVTFRSRRGALPDPALSVIPAHLLHDHGVKYEFFFGVVMPDHVHLLITPLEKLPNVWCDLRDILGPMKGASARSINKLLATSGPVWQDESFDRIVRDQEEHEEKVAYMWNNPVKAGLVGRVEDWPHYVLRPSEADSRQG
jgi:REP element-mobilizing transposase RayT